MRPVVFSSRRVAAASLALAAAAMLVLRLHVVLYLPDGEADAYGHFGAARALVEDPTNLKVHWVWLPGWHYVLWAMIRCGLSFQIRDNRQQGPCHPSKTSSPAHS